MKKHSFKWLSLATGLLYLWLFYQLLFTPGEMLRSFGVEPNGGTLFLAKRISVLMLGFAVLTGLAVCLTRSTARAVIAAAVAVNMTGFAINTLWGAAHGNLIDPAMPVVGGVESFVALAYGWFAIADFRAARRSLGPPAC